MSAAAPEADPADDDDEAAIARVLAGDTAAFRVLVERYGASVLRLVRGLTSAAGPWTSPAAHEDVAQDSFVSAFQALGTFDPRRGRFGSWLLTIAKNNCINAQKKGTPLLFADPPEVAAPTTPDDDLARADTRRRLDAALEELPEDLRTCFVLVEIVGLPTGAMADMDRVSVGTIRSRLSRAKARLRAALSPLRGKDP
jgi:RNA polymerase sigma-70 factor (ECF subfamily)